MKIDERNIFEQGVLIHLKIGGYEGRVKLSPEQMRDLPTEIVRGVHDIFDKAFKDKLKAINLFDSNLRDMVKRMAIPFPIDGVYFIRGKYINKTIDMLEEQINVRQGLVEEAVEDYDSAIATFEDRWPDYYEHAKSKYLSIDRFKERFYIKYRFIQVTAPNKDASFISPEMYKEEMGKFKEAIDEMKGEVLSTIYSALLEMTERLKTQCTDGKPNQRTLNNLNVFLNKIDDVYSDFIDRKDMQDTIRKIRAQVLGIDAESLRNSESAKQKFGKEIAAIAKEIKALPDIPLKRAIDF